MLKNKLFLGLLRYMVEQLSLLLLIVWQKFISF